MSFGSWLKSLIEKSGIKPTPAPGPVPPIEPVGEKLLWYPEARTNVKKMPARGKYAKGYPKGAIVHWTEGHQTQSMEDAIAYGASQGYCYMFIDYKGNVAQSVALSDWGYHAGSSSFTGLSLTVSDDLVGIEIGCSGKLVRKKGLWQTTFGKVILAEDVIEGPKKDNCVAGGYQKYTHEQFESLVRLLLWLKRNNPEVFSFDFVLGHDEVSPGRKTDPGWSLGMTMPEFRKLLKDRYNA